MRHIQITRHYRQSHPGGSPLGNPFLSRLLIKWLCLTGAVLFADYLLEGILLAVASGLAGWAVSYGIAAAVNTIPKQDMFGGLPVSGATTALAFAALGVIAIASAVWPAWRAASLTPVQALSYER